MAYTENGDTVVLYNNGQWEYLENFLDTEKTAYEIPTNNTKFSKPKKSTEQAGGGKGGYEIWYNPVIWKRIPPAEINEDADNAFEMKGDDAFAAVIFERMEIPMESLLEIALENAQTVAPDANLVKQEWRTVNGQKVLFGQIEGTLSGIKFTYYSYYFSNGDGTIQFTTFTGQGIFDELRPAMEDLLNGLIILD
ncbi:MAG: hypothetical protein KDC34_10300 [Saprospiraceae bacterium]|nr:hypothetical protein [Saprospiraceae bacterium]